MSKIVNEAKVKNPLIVAIRELLSIELMDVLIAR